MKYPLRAGILHGLLFVLVGVAFILPVLFGSAALLPVPLAAWASVLLSALALVDASYHAFSPSQRPTRGLRALSAVGGVALISGWLVWLRIYNTIDLVSAMPYRIGTFLLAVGAVLSAFCLAIALTHRGER
ncbi:MULTISPECIES: hypothetical protein [unclassified Corynebacterium]|uniref:hypothetical protein n=1 Tax=unclassified Corynebacterium TaxID=2624378 RepID=UPI0008A4E191|nr:MULTISPECIES: hypothetical protein [unclassified Corynebacterium]OFN76624.1 hypothetical protein HMPREF2537_08540 [Corynebacterium sp. HMSC074E01]OFP63387.1 hypothetical protein HMPREF2978_11360 [Corynebacterium sp. HMSC074C01]OHO65690.1 hypothetical protein HMPREF2743_06345 [Corynebacterium sp. HMSC036D02]